MSKSEGHPSFEHAQPAAPARKRLAFFERYLTVWVFGCMGVGLALGKLAPDATASLSRLEFGQGSQVADYPRGRALYGDGVRLVVSQPMATRPTRWSRWR